jgi:hypothetical protein
VYVQGKTGFEHVFDFVSRPRRHPKAKTVAVKLLPPSVGPNWQVTRYGYMVLDIDRQQAARWPRLAVISKAEEWSSKAIDMVKSLSDDVILLAADHEERIEQLLPPKMTALTDAA